MADRVLKVIPNVGEVGIDTNASPGNGPYYVKSYIVEYDVCGFDDRKSTRLNSSHIPLSRMPSSA